MKNDSSAFNFQQFRKYSYAISIAVLLFVVFWGVNALLSPEEEQSPNVATEQIQIQNQPSSSVNNSPLNNTQVRPATSTVEELDIKTAQNEKNPLADTSKSESAKKKDPHIKYVDGTK